MVPLVDGVVARAVMNCGLVRSVAVRNYCSMPNCVRRPNCCARSAMERRRTVSEVIDSPYVSSDFIVEMLRAAMHVDTSHRVASCTVNTRMAIVCAR